MQHMSRQGDQPNAGLSVFSFQETFGTHFILCHENTFLENFNSTTFTCFNRLKQTLELWNRQHHVKVAYEVSIVYRVLQMV